jgi:NADH-quinone oxidoreductase subunit L
MFLTFHGRPRMSHEVEHHIHESPTSMTMPLVILAVASIVAGFLGFPHSLARVIGIKHETNHFEHFLEPVFAREGGAVLEEKAAGQIAAGAKEEEHTNPMEYGLMFLSVLAALAGWGTAWKFYRHTDKGFTEPIAEKTPPLYKVLYHKYFVDEAYDYAFTGRRKIGNTRLGVMGLGEAASWFDTHIIDGTVNFAGWLTRGVGWLSSMWDKIVIDGIAVNGPAYFAQALSVPVKLLQWGLVQWYALVMVVGLVGFVAYYTFR